MRTVVVCGNPKAASRTLRAAVTTAELLCGGHVDQVVDVTTLGPGLLGRGDETVTRTVTEVASADLLVVASPTYKATYSGLLKLFLDQFAGGEGLLLKPVLAELGASCPAPGLYLIDEQVEQQGAGTPALAAYVDRWRSTLLASAGVGRGTLSA